MLNDSSVARAEDEKDYDPEISEIVHEPSALRKALDINSDLKRGYIDNAACILMDNIPGLKQGAKALELRNKVAELLVDKLIR